MNPALTPFLKVWCGRAVDFHTKLDARSASLAAARPCWARRAHSTNAPPPRPSGEAGPACTRSGASRRVAASRRS
eukprot:scaffold106613_cov61-Phaeocystis_antarctica.AAC.4